MDGEKRKEPKEEIPAWIYAFEDIEWCVEKYPKVFRPMVMGQGSFAKAALIQRKAHATRYGDVEKK